MLFNSLTFAIFFVAVLALHRLAPGWPAKKVVLLVASYLFYAAWNPPYVLILAASTALDWWLARRIGASADARRRKALLAVSLVANLGVLATFKYLGFALANLRALAALAGIDYVPPAWNLVLPVGISFYTFASLSYTIDVYRGHLRGDARFLDYALFVSFFPHLVAGPIVRADVLLPQIETPRRATADQFGWGLVLLACGLACKAVLADAIFAPIVDAVYAAPQRFGALDSWTAVLAFSGQIYYDFSGYSLCAIGIALCFGFAFPDNFRQPYAASGFSDFWRRWHISLSTWLRDYLYKPLGGSRGGRFATYRNLMLTMLIGGLWHGASWMFVLWGGLHGAYLVVERWWSGDRSPRSYGPLGVLATFLVVTLTWIPFRAESPATAGAVARGLLNFAAPSLLDPLAVAIALVAMLATLRWQYALRFDSFEGVAARWGTARVAIVVAVALTALFACSGGDGRAFIYFQF